MSQFSTWSLALFFIALVVAPLHPPLASAQGGRATATARRLYRTGVRALETQDFAAAEDAFRRSYEVAPRPLTLFNLGLAESGAGHVVRASETLRTFIREATEDRYAEYRSDAERELARVEARIGTVTLRATNVVSSDEVHLDAERLSSAELGTPLTLDPGSHVATVSRAGEEVVREEFDVGDGASLTVEIAAPAPPVEESVANTPGPDGALAPDQAPAEDEDSGGVNGWVVFGIVAAVLVAGGVTAAVVIATTETEQAHTGSLGTFTIR